MDPREAFRTELIEATLEATRSAASRFAEERIYSFALYTSGEYNYVFASISTMAGLKDVAGRYLARAGFRRKWGDLGVAMRHLKWSPCDSPHHEALLEGFAAAQDRLDTLWNACEDDVDDEDYDDEAADDDYSQLCTFALRSFAEALLHVRRAGIFDDTVTLNILMGDQSDDERLEFAAALNDAPVVERLRVDLMERLEA